ncbi:MAG: hypothetical protein ACYS22_15100 [Planctomycetota bacterium]
MFVRIKRSGRGEKVYEYLQIVESYRKDGKVRQRVIGTLGRLDALKSSKKLDGLIKSMCRFTENLEVVATNHSSPSTALPVPGLG